MFHVPGVTATPKKRCMSQGVFHSMEYSIHEPADGIFPAAPHGMMTQGPAATQVGGGGCKLLPSHTTTTTTTTYIRPACVRRGCKKTGRRANWKLPVGAALIGPECRPCAQQGQERSTVATRTPCKLLKKKMQVDGDTCPGQAPGCMYRFSFLSCTHRHPTTSYRPAAIIVMRTRRRKSLAN